MALEIVQEDLFKVQADTVVVTINLRGAMGAGVARAARDTVPGLYSHYKKMYATLAPEQFIFYPHEGKNYLLVPTKIDWRDPSPRSLVIHNLNRLAVISSRTRQLGTIALPPLGCGHGGLSWDGDIKYVYQALFPFVDSKFIACIGVEDSHTARELVKYHNRYIYEGEDS